MDGVLIVNKPQGMTSHDVVDFFRKRFGLKKVGHAGTLDPMATGVLVILIGKATELFETFSSDDKEYEAAVLLGKRSDTGDIWGNITDSGLDGAKLKAESIEEAFSKFLGPIEQIPPMYSALKYNGKKLYELARKGLDIVRPPRKIVISKLEILAIDLPEVTFRISCSKGTYIRQICVDIGDRLGCGGCLSRLNRTRSGKFSIDEATGLDEFRGFKLSDLEERLRRL